MNVSQIDNSTSIYVSDSSMESISNIDKITFFVFGMLAMLGTLILLFIVYISRSAVLKIVRGLKNVDNLPLLNFSPSQSDSQVYQINSSAKSKTSRASHWSNNYEYVDEPLSPGGQNLVNALLSPERALKKNHGNDCVPDDFVLAKSERIIAPAALTTNLCRHELNKGKLLYSDDEY